MASGSWRSASWRTSGCKTTSTPIVLTGLSYLLSDDDCLFRLCVHGPAWDDLHGMTLCICVCLCIYLFIHIRIFIYPILLSFYHNPSSCRLSSFLFINKPASAVPHASSLWYLWQPICILISCIWISLLNEISWLRCFQVVLYTIDVCHFVWFCLVHLSKKLKELEHYYLTRLWDELSTNWPEFV